MQLTGKTRKQLALQNLIYYGLLLVVFGLLAWVSVRYSWQSDWSAGARNTLSDASLAVLEQLQGPVEVSAFIGEDEITRQAIRELLARYQRHKRNLKLAFINPDTNPARVRALGVASSGELLIDYRGRTERLQQLSEQTLTNALQRLARDEDRWVVFLSGHGERDPYGQANHAFSEFTRRLTDKGFHVQTHSLLESAGIPGNTHALVIADPRSAYLPGEVGYIAQYLQTGGNLLWLTEPGDLKDLQPLAEALGFSLLPGVIVDAATQSFGIEQADFALVLNYPYTPITPDFAQFTLFPQAAGLKLHAQNILGLRAKPFLQTLPRSWTETGPIEGTITFNENSAETAGPVTLGVSLSRSVDPNSGDSPGREQRVVVIGDSDFLSNAFLGNGGNLELGLNIFNWLSHDDQFINIAPIGAPDTQLQLTDLQVMVIAILFFLVLPLGFVATGLIIWLKRRKL
ncbi:MAG TPA: GldG family protein [Gammaproteobacteria bacterium]|jgi:ABC-type uncharacterized transport system involved in gliding motility auxiliary subunit